MSGIVREAKEIRKAIAKRKKAVEKQIQMSMDQGIDPGYTIDEALKTVEQQHLEEFAAVCELAVKLRDIAVSTGFVQSRETIEGPERLDGKYAMITIRPKEGEYDLEHFHIYLLAWLKKKYFLGGVYTFEQCGEDTLTMGKGWHVHIICKLKPYVQFQELKRDVERCIPGVINESYTFEVGNEKRKFLSTKRDLEYCLNYIEGDKHNDDKVAAVNINNEWRRAMNLQRIYTWGDKVYNKECDLLESSPVAESVTIEEVA